MADDPAVERSWGRIRRGAAPAALGFLLLVPLQIGATWHGIASFSNPRTPQQTAALQRLASHRQAIAAATSSADLRARLQALQAPPLPLARQQLLQSLAKAEVRLQRRFERERGRNRVGPSCAKACRGYCWPVAMACCSCLSPAVAWRI